MNHLLIEKKTKEITDEIYFAYGSGTGVLFGIPSNLKPSVRAIIKTTLRIIDTSKEKKEILELADKIIKEADIVSTGINGVNTAITHNAKEIKRLLSDEYADDVTD